MRVTLPNRGRTFPLAAQMNRLIRLVLELMPQELRQLTLAAGLDVEATCRLQPLAELFTLAREHHGWSPIQAARAARVRRRSISAIEAANPAQTDAEELIAYAARLGMLHLLGEWVTANPRLARSMGFPGETELLGFGRNLLAEDARLANLLPSALSALVVPRFEAPQGWSNHLDPDRAEKRLAAIFSYSSIHGTPGSGHAKNSFVQMFGGPSQAGPPSPSPDPAPPALYQFKVTLRGIRPPIWRRIIVSNHISFGQFHEVLQAAMGWRDSHLHVFRWESLEIGVSDPEWPHPLLDESETLISALALKKGSRVEYLYDFGDDWKHDLTLEAIHSHQPDFVPECVKGARACPPEDCGGPPAYPHLVAAITQPMHPDHKTLRDWMGRAWDPEHFNPSVANRELLRLSKSWKNKPRRRTKT